MLTVSRKASSEVNRVALTQLLSREQALADVQYDNDEPLLPMYKGMTVIITQNQDKRNGVTNGQPGTVVTMENATIVLKLRNRNIVASIQSRRLSMTNSVSSHGANICLYDLQNTGTDPEQDCAFARLYSSTSRSSLCAL